MQEERHPVIQLSFTNIPCPLGWMDPGLWWHKREYGLIPALRVTAVYRRSLNPSYTSRAIGDPSVTIPIYMKLNHFAGHLKLTQHCKSNMCVCLLSHVWLYDPTDCSHPGSSVHGICQARILKLGCHFLLWRIFPTRDKTHISCISCTAGGFFTTAPLAAGLFLATQSYPTLCSLPGSSMSIAILQARILEWVSIPSSRGASHPRDRTQVSCIAGRFFTIWATREAP